MTSVTPSQGDPQRHQEPCGKGCGLQGRHHSGFESQGRLVCIEGRPQVTSEVFGVSAHDREPPGFPGPSQTPAPVRSV